MDAISQVVADAQNQAKNLPVPAAATQTAVALPVKRTTAAAFLANERTSVDIFLKIEKAGGLRLGTSKAQVAEFEAELDCSKLQFPIQVVYGDPVVYAKTYDGGATVQNSGLNWQRHLELAKSWKNTAQTNPFETVDLVLRLVGDVTGYEMGKPVVVAKAGQVVGYTPPFTGVPGVHALLKQIAAAGGDVEKSKVRVKVIGTSKTNNKGQEYGILQVTLVSLV